jgi:hypothetical protein
MELWLIKQKYCSWGHGLGHQSFKLKIGSALTINEKGRCIRLKKTNSDSQNQTRIQVTPIELDG